jgi:hypothetical protein
MLPVDLFENMTTYLGAYNPIHNIVKIESAINIHNTFWQSNR